MSDAVQASDGRPVGSPLGLYGTPTSLSIQTTVGSSSFDKRPPSMLATFLASASRSVLSVECGAVLLFLATVCAIVLRVANPWDRADVLMWIHICCVLFQRSWALVVCVFIVFGSSPMGPSLVSKIVLVAALFAGAVGDLPLDIVHALLSQVPPFRGCPLWVASVYDVLLMLQWVSVILWAVFARAEFWRNHAELFHEVISHTQNIVAHRRL